MLSGSVSAVMASWFQMIVQVAMVVLLAAVKSVVSSSRLVAVGAVLLAALKRAGEGLAERAC